MKLKTNKNAQTSIERIYEKHENPRLRYLTVVSCDLEGISHFYQFKHNQSQEIIWNLLKRKVDYQQKT